jgi:acyl-coenzyme A thioesterase PaaI-like protein
VTGFHAPDAGRTISQYLGLTLREVPSVGPTEEPSVIVGTVDVADHLRTSRGNVAPGALLALVDSAGGLCAGLAALPGWVVSTNLMMSTARFDHAGPITLTARVLRAGRAAVITGIQVTDDGNGDALIADGVLTSAVLEPADGPPVWPRPLLLAAPPVDPAGVPPLAEFLGTEATSDHSMALTLGDHLRNPWGILHGGATAALVDAVAEHTAGPGYRSADIVLHFLAPGRLGPVDAEATVVGDRPDGRLLEVTVSDGGAAARVMALAVVTLRTA